MRFVLREPSYLSGAAQSRRAMPQACLGLETREGESKERHSHRNAEHWAQGLPPAPRPRLLLSVGALFQKQASPRNNTLRCNTDPVVDPSASHEDSERQLTPP